LVPVHVAWARCCPADRDEEGCGEVAGGEDGKGDVVVGDVAVVEGDLGEEGCVALGASAEEEVDVLLEGVALDDVGVMAGFGPELVVEEEEPVRRCSHVELPFGASAADCLPMGTILRESC